MLINVMTDALTANPFFLTGYTTFGYVFPPFSIVRKTGIYEPEKPFSLLLSKSVFPAVFLKLLAEALIICTHFS